MTQSLRIALYHNLPSGGAKRTLYEAVRRMGERHQIDVYTLSSANHDFADLRPYTAAHHVFDFRPQPLLKSPFGRLNQGIRLADLLRLGSLTRRIAQQIEAEHYDLVFVHPCQVEKSSSLLRHLRRLPSVYYCQEPLRLLYETMPSRPYDDDHFPRRRLLNRLDPLRNLYFASLKRNDQRNTRMAGSVLVNSRFMRAAVERIYKVEARVSYHGIDTNRFRPLSLPKRRMILSVGSLTALKGFDFLIQALARIPSEQRPPLVVASNFQVLEERIYLEGLAQELGVRVELMGNVSDEKLVELYNQALVTVYAPVREPFGLVTLESAACATPVIAVREGGTHETVIHEHTGLLVDRDLEQFAAAIQQLISSPNLSSEYGRNGREHVLRNWTWDQAVDTLEQHLLSSLEKKGSTAAEQSEFKVKVRNS